MEGNGKIIVVRGLLYRRIFYDETGYCKRRLNSTATVIYSGLHSRLWMCNVVAGCAWVDKLRYILHL